MQRLVICTLTAVIVVAAASVCVAADGVKVTHALALHGEPKYADGFDRLEYVDAGAVKGGDVKLAQIGTFDNLNPFILKGVSAAGVAALFDTLTYNADDEPFTEYGLIAESIEVSDDHTWVAYNLRPQARFHNGRPITAQDVVFSLQTLKTKGHPFYRSYYASVTKAEALGEHKVKFTFSDSANRELPLIVGQMPVLSMAYWSGRDFEKTTLEPPLGSGPYRVESVNPGRSITYRRVEDYWAKDLPVSVGRNNFDTIRYDYYRDATVALQAFKAGEYDFRAENIAKEWATGYDGPALRDGLIRKEEIAHERPTGMQAFVFNTRREMFADPRVRRALSSAFDFEWTNRSLFYGAYTRTSSYFSNSELASRGLPQGEELAILERFRDKIPQEVFTTEYKPPSTDGSGFIRANLRSARRLLQQAGWIMENGVLRNEKTGKPFTFEMLLVSPSFERVVLPFRKNLYKLGINMSVRTVDSAQYEKRLEDFDFDMIVFSQGQSLSPGNEQRNFWASEKADVPGSRNLVGIKDPVVDELIELLIAAPDREALVARIRALDRVLLWGHYVIPQWHLRIFRVAYWNRFSRPSVTPKYALGFDTWWVDPTKDTGLARRSTASK